MTEQEKKGKKGQKHVSGSSLPTMQQTRTPEERFRMQQEAKAQGKKEPDKAFEQRLEALKRSAKSRSQVMLPCTCVTHDSVFLHKIVQGLRQQLALQLT